MNFISPVKEIDGIFIDKMPSSKPVKVARAVTVGRVTLMQTESGRLYSPNSKPFCYTPGHFAGHDDWFRALKALRVLTKEQLEKHKAACDRADKRRSMRYAADALVRAVKDGAPPLTAKQRAFVEEHGSKKEAA